MKIYSPSQTVAFMECPTNRELSSIEKYVPIRLTRKEIGGIAGTAFAVGAEQYHKWLSGKPTGALEEDVSKQWVMQAGAATVEELSDYTEAGCELSGDLADFRHSLPGLVMRGVRRYIDKAPIPKLWNILSVEETIREAGYCRPDLIFDLYDALGMADVKFKLRLDKRYKDQTILEYLNSWQFYHYAWAASLVHKRPCKTMTLILVTLEPFDVDIKTVSIEEEKMKLWKESADTVWRIMNAVDGNCEPLMERIRTVGDLYPWHTFKFWGKFGKESFSDAVLEYNLDPNSMKQGYVILDRKSRQRKIE